MDSIKKNLEISYRSYSAYHEHPVNKWINIFCAPLIFSSSVQILSEAGVHEYFLWTVGSLFAGSHCIFKPVPGLLYLPLMYSYFRLALSGFYGSIVWQVWFGGRVAQIIGNLFFEEKRPALIGFQAVYSEVFFVWIQFLISIGLLPRDG